MTDTTILHLSDLHLGRELAWRRLLPSRWGKTPNDPSILRAIADAIDQIKPDYVVVSGDIVNTCTEDTFKYAQGQLRSMFGAGFDVKRRLLIIPGNHDVRVFPEEDAYFGRLKEFVTFLKRFFDEEDYRSRTERFTVSDSQRKLCFFCLDSTLKKAASRKDGQPVAEGMVGRTNHSTATRSKCWHLSWTGSTA